ncbi:uncharacterized protein LOC125033960 [Penaeus chinensis]|uniref:uncharacterized protein LOC125033960 n=1 Tax=Penaeus chinensis TaxID=139456 RepID=UPI001FB6F1F9|nr:uncharacterized protein LOC125033960 [Penaeus chinensis]
MTPEQCRKHSWIRNLGGQPKAELNKRNLRQYMSRRRWHTAVHTVTALRRMGANLSERREPTNQDFVKTKSSTELCGLERESLSSSGFSNSRSANELQSLESPTTEAPSRLAPVAEKETESSSPSLGNQSRSSCKKSKTVNNKDPPTAQPSQEQNKREVLYIEAKEALRRMAGQIPSSETSNSVCLDDHRQTKQRRNESPKSKDAPTSIKQRREKPPSQPVPRRPPSVTSSTRVPPVLELARRRSSGMTIQYPSTIGKPRLEAVEQAKVGPRSLVDQLLGQFKGMQSFSFAELRTTKGPATLANAVVSKPVFQFRMGRPINSGAVLEIAKKFMGFE